jgi:Zn-dependent alcohol dehydrogenase
VRKIAQMESGATVAVFGLGTVGLSVSVGFHNPDNLDQAGVRIFACLPICCS